VTHRGVASSVTIVSGHLVDVAGADPVDGRDWAAIAAAPGTLVVLMAASTAAAVASGLLAAGRRDEPVAVVHAATTGDQQVARSTLRRLARSGSPFPAPSVLVIGPVADPTALAALAGPGSARAGSVARS
jgi:siroheme synthase